MPSFEIPDGPTTIALKSEGGFHKGSAVFSVTNKTGEGLTARLSVQVQGDGKPEWHQVQGESERPVAAGETQTVTVVAKIPGATPAGQHRIKLRAINVNDPDNDSTDSSAAAVIIPMAGGSKPVRKPFPWWILAVVGSVLVVVIGVIIAIVVMTSKPKVPNVVGQSYAEATRALDKAGYKTATQTDEQSDEKADTVIRQAPVAGTEAAKTTSIALTVAVAKVVAVIETQVDRPGGDYKNYDLDEVGFARCQADCEQDNKCRAWTYVMPGIQGPKPRCWLKSSEPPPVASNCCVSGVR